MSSKENDPASKKPASKPADKPEASEQHKGDVTRLYKKPTVDDQDKTRIYRKPETKTAQQKPDDEALINRHNKTPNTSLLNAEDIAYTDQTMLVRSSNPHPEQSQPVPAAALDNETDVINRRFVLDAPLGSGGMGTVYKAKDLRKVEARDRNPWVAIKLLNNAFKDHPDAFISLQREARKTQGLAHPNIVRVYDFDREGDTVYMTMELLEGEALDAVIKKHPTGIGKQAAFQLIREVGGALVEAHSLNIIHSDLKPGNIFYTKEKKAKVFDFGIARAVSSIDADKDDKADQEGRKKHRDQTLFDAGSLGALTPAYASYEMLTGKTPSASDDLYALGCVAYQALTGQHPYGRLPADKVHEKKLKPISIDGLSRREARALRKAVSTTRKDRYESVEAFLKDFLPENQRWTIKLKIATAGLVVLLAAGGYQYNEIITEERQRNEALKQEEIKAQKKAEAFKQMQERHASQQALDASMQAAFAKQQEKAADLQRELDQQIYLSAFADDYKWQLDTTRKIQTLKELYKDDSWLTPFRESHPGPDYADIINNMENTRIEADQRIDTWIGYLRKKIANIYIEEADNFIADKQFEKADDMLKLANQYDADGDPVQALSGRLNDAKVEQEKIRQARKAKARAASYAKQNKKLTNDVKQCAAGLAKNTRAKNFRYDINAFAKKARQLAQRYKYLGNTVRKNTTAHARELANCIQLYGYSDPKGAKAQLALAAKAFPGHRQLFTDVVIRPFNTCKASFAKKGRRYTCEDRFIENLHIKGPKLVVIPANAETPMFAIAKYELTEGEFNRYCKATGKCKPTPETMADLPVTHRSTEAITAYLQWLSQQTGFEYQVPTYKQWQYAATANDPTLDQNRNCTLSVRGVNKGLRLIPTSSGEANTWGLVNHVGNAQEWVKTATGNAMAGAAHITPMGDCHLASLRPVLKAEAGINTIRPVRLIK